MTEKELLERNIRDAARNGEITWAQRDELMSLVLQDVNSKLELARGVLYALTGRQDNGSVAG